MEDLDGPIDVVHGIGMIAIHSAYAEEEIDNVLAALDELEPFSESVQKLPTSRKLSHAKRLLALLPDAAVAETISLLDIGSSLFERRNELLHGRIYAGIDGPDKVHSGRRGVPMREVTLLEVAALAAELENYWEALFEQHLLVIPAAIKASRDLPPN